MEETKRVKTGIVIRAPAKRRKEGVGGINSILQEHFCCLLVGKPGSGKSHLLFELLMNPSLYFKKFDRVLFCTPTKLDLPCGDNWKAFLDIPWILSEIGKLKAGSNCLVVLDDVIAEIKKEQNNKDLMRLIFNRRHLIPSGTVSIILTSQKYMVCPTRIRSCLSSLILFKLNPSDWKKVKEECIQADAMQSGTLIKDTFSKPYSFLYCRLDNGDVYKNFSDKIL